MAKYLRIALLVALVLALLPTTFSSAQDKVTLRITNWAGVDEAAEFQEIVDEVNAMQDGFELIYEPKPADYYTVLQTALAGNEAPDLFWLDQGSMTWAYDGVLLPIDDYLANDDRPTADPSDYFPGVWDTGLIDGKSYGLPWIAQPVVVFYNKDIFDEMGVAYPTPDWTWDDFKQIAMDLTNEDHYGFTMTEGWPPPEIWVWSYGGRLVSEDLTQAPIDSPEVIAGIDMWASMIWNPECCVPQEIIAEEGFEAMMRAGRVAMFMGGAADDYERSTEGTVGVSMVPKGPAGENVTNAWTAFTAINVDTEHPDEAYDAMVLLTEGVQHWKPSPRISHATVEFLTESIPYKADTAADIVAALPYMRGYTLFPGFGEFMWSTWRGEFTTPVANGDDTAEALAPDIRILLEDILASNQ
jgi:multiple sugar transport system substrate-binding protein